MTSTTPHRKDARKTFLDVPAEDILAFAEKQRVAPFHELIRAWRSQQARETTLKKRPDLAAI